jgi:hypothetical protein
MNINKEILIEDVVSFETAKLAKDAGYSNGTQLIYVQYGDNFIYDDDPEHPESHKKGEIRSYNIWHHNGFDWSNDNESNKDDIYEVPSHSMLYKWLRKHFNVQINILFVDTVLNNKPLFYYGEVYYMTNERRMYRYLINNAISYEDCFEECLKEALKKLLLIKKEND